MSTCLVNTSCTLLTQDCHNIINDQDAVARSGKASTVFVRLLERPGHKILVNKRGEMLVQPSPMEAYLQLRMGFASWEDHVLSSYDEVRVECVFLLMFYCTVHTLSPSPTCPTSPMHPHPRS